MSPMTDGQLSLMNESAYCLWASDLGRVTVSKNTLEKGRDIKLVQLKNLIIIFYYFSRDLNLLIVYLLSYVARNKL